MLTGFLESRIAAGVTFQPGQTVQCSWMWLKVGEDLKGQTVLLAPLAGATPMEFGPDCSLALNLVLTQRYLCDSFGVEPSACSALQSAIVIKDLGACRNVFMNRIEVEDGHTSGWYFGASDSKLDVNRAENLELKSLWDLSCHYPISQDFFLLPPGWQVLFERQATVLTNFEPAIPKVNSYYAKIFRG